MAHHFPTSGIRADPHIASKLHEEKLQHSRNNVEYVRFWVHCPCHWGGRSSLGWICHEGRCLHSTQNALCYTLLYRIINYLQKNNINFILSLMLMHATCDTKRGLITRTGALSFWKRSRQRWACKHVRRCSSTSIIAWKFEESKFCNCRQWCTRKWAAVWWWIRKHVGLSWRECFVPMRKKKTRTIGAKRPRTDGAIDGSLVNMLTSFSEKSDAKLDKLVDKMASDKVKHSSMRKKMFTCLKNTTHLSLTQKIKITSAICDRNGSEIFLTTRVENREMMIRMILDGNY